MFLESQINYLLWLQKLRADTHDILTPFFFYITSLGEYFLPILICATIYWCIDKKLGALLILNSSLSMTINHLLKSIACISRPWILDSRIKPVEMALPHAGGYSFPSGHSSFAVACWGAIGLWYRNNKKVLFSAIIICLLIAFSRTYLGVHTLQDILIGLIVAFVVLIALYKALNWCEAKENRDIILVLAVSVISILITTYTYFKDYPPLHDTLANIITDQTLIKGAGFSRLGLVLGAFWGWYLERRFIKFDPTCGSIKTKIIRIIVGFTLFISLVIFADPLFNHWFEKQLGSFTYMLTISSFITLIYPWMVTKIKFLKGTPDNN